MTLADLHAALLAEFTNDAPEQDIYQTMHLLHQQYPAEYRLICADIAAGIRDAHTTH